MMTWDTLLNGSAASQASNDPGDFKVVATATVTYFCGTTNEMSLIRERGSWYVQHPGYSERFTSKKKAIAAYPAFA
jgi:hypothetical protein